jgi:dTMP kinase
MKKIKKGKFIVIEGTDGSGKTKQFEKLAAKLLKIGKQIAKFDFPQYDKPSSFFVREYLNGNYGSADDVGPKKGSLFYALDRFDAGFSIRQAEKEGKICISNRYIGSNMGHQGGKIKTEKGRREYFKWLDELEFGILGIPKPDINIILHVPAEIAQSFVDKKSKAMRKYANGKKRDIHEADIKHLKHAEMVYLEIAKLFPKNFVLVECVENGRMLSIDEVHEKVWKIVKKVVS